MFVRFKRIFAAMIDFALIVVVSLVIGMTVALGDGGSPLAIWVYFALCVIFGLFKDKALGNASVGKSLLGISVREKGEDRLSLWGCVKRGVTYVIPQVEVPVMLATGRRIGDRLAKTTVEQQASHARLKVTGIVKYIVVGAIFIVEYAVFAFVSSLESNGIISGGFPGNGFPWNIIGVFVFLWPLLLTLFFLGREPKFTLPAKRLCRVFFWGIFGIFAVASIVEVVTVIL